MSQSVFSDVNLAIAGHAAVRALSVNPRGPFIRQMVLRQEGCAIPETQFELETQQHSLKETFLSTSSSQISELLVWLRGSKVTERFRVISSHLCVEMRKNTFQSNSCQSLSTP